MNADLAVSAVIIDVGERMQSFRFLDRGQRCGVGKKDFNGGQQSGEGVNADLTVSAVASDVV